MGSIIQELITYAIVAGALLYVGVKFVKMVRKKPAACEEESPGCRGCQLKESCKMTNASYQ
jgi:hypothetical protein